jgi:hypothetical protein
VFSEFNLCRNNPERHSGSIYILPISISSLPIWFFFHLKGKKVKGKVVPVLNYLSITP